MHKSLLLGVLVAGVVGSLCQLGDTTAAVWVVRACAGHLDDEVKERLYSRILEHSKPEGEA